MKYYHCAILLGLVAVGLTVAARSSPAAFGNISGIPPCATEDSTCCYWDAASMGDGNGLSFIALTEGIAVYQW